MKMELIIEKYGQGNAVVVLDRREIVDLFVDPPSNSNFYPPNTFVEAKIQRRISKRGGYFITLPNSLQGFLKSKSDYKEGEAVVLRSKVFFEEDKPQIFTDRLKVFSKYFILELCNSGFSFSKKIPNKFAKEQFSQIIKTYIKIHKNIFVICRSKIVGMSLEQFNEELEKILHHNKLIKEELLRKKIYCDGLAKKVALDQYDLESNLSTEEEGIFELRGLWNQIDEFCQKKYYIRNGSYLILEQTSSFFAIDVNSGKNLKMDAKELNLLACVEICRLTKILGFGGKIIVDFLPCSKLVKKEISEFFRDFFSRDNIRTKVWGWTDGGAFELERERHKIPLKLLLKHNLSWTN